jgi:fructan beta-fructosidase
MDRRDFTKMTVIAMLTSGKGLAYAATSDLDDKEAAFAKNYISQIKEYYARPDRFTEPWRPQYHYTPVSGWMNDPCGLVYFKGKWRLFMQHNGWGYATSDDLLHWKHQPVAIRPDENGSIWSGSAVVDFNDSSGLFNGKAGLVCIFTYKNSEQGNRQSQAIAYSSDGKNFIKYSKNPVIPQLRHLPGQPDDERFRDAKVFWHEPTQRWVLVAAGGKLRFFSSKNLLDWTYQSTNTVMDAENHPEDIWTECPDLFELAVDGDQSQKMWVLSGGGDWYMLGEIDGKKFTPVSGKIDMNAGQDFYASQSWSDAPDGRRIMTTWMFSWHYARKGKQPPTKLWTGGGMTLPYELSLKTTEQGVRLFMTPVKELETLRADKYELQSRALDSAVIPIKAKNNTYEIIAEFEPGDTGEFGFELFKSKDGSEKVVVGYDAQKQEMYVDRSFLQQPEIEGYRKKYKTSLKPQNNLIKMHIFVDTSSVEVFANDGQKVFTLLAHPKQHGQELELFCKNGKAKLTKLQLYQLKSVWRQQL